MTWVSNGGARPEDVDPFETLAPLATAATVRIHPPREGYDGGVRDGGPRPWGSGFFVAPGWVLTCAHVALRGGGGTAAEGGRREVGLSFGDTDRPAYSRGVVEWAQPEYGPDDEPWSSPDLALIRLLEPQAHECAWLTDRTSVTFTSEEVAFFGCAEEGGRIEPISGRCTVLGTVGVDGRLKLGHQDEIPEGASGGPIVDLERGEVIGVLKARRTMGRDGGLGMSVLQLRRLPQAGGPATGPHGDLYHHVLHAHDRYHAQRHSDATIPSPTWTDAQSELRVTPGRVLTPGQRTELLGLLAELPHPASTRQLGAMITELGGRPHATTVPAPRGWRDALGALYDPGAGRAGLETIVRFAVYAATADHRYPTSREAEDQLLAWAHRTAAEGGLPRWVRTRLQDEQFARQRARSAAFIDALATAPYLDDPFQGGYTPRRPPEPGAAPGSPGTLPAPLPAPVSEPRPVSLPPPRPAPPPAPQPCVLLEITRHGWEPSRYDWQVYAPLPTGGLIAVDGDTRARGYDQPPERLRAALEEACRRADEGDRPVMLLAALPYSLLGLPLDEWHVTGEPGTRLGDQRPVVVRCAEPDPAAEDDEERRAARLTRWEKVHTGPMTPAVLDCADNRPRPLPEAAALAACDPDTVPVLCRTGTGADDPAALYQVIAGGYSVVLWRREIAAREPDCADFHAGITHAVTGAERGGRLPEELRRLRATAGAGAPESSWSRGLALLYADPTQPLPGADDLLEAL